jgi:hypothetical protein
MQGTPERLVHFETCAIRTVLNPVAVTGADVNEDKENPEVLFTGHSPRFRLLVSD